MKIGAKNSCIFSNFLSFLQCLLAKPFYLFLFIFYLYLFLFLSSEFLKFLFLQFYSSIVTFQKISRLETWVLTNYKFRVCVFFLSWMIRALKIVLFDPYKSCRTIETIKLVYYICLSHLPVFCSFSKFYNCIQIFFY